MSGGERTRNTSLGPHLPSIALRTTIAPDWRCSPCSRSGWRKRSTATAIGSSSPRGTIGAIAWLARNEEKIARIRHGLIVSCVGDAGVPTYKKSRRGDATIDRAMTHILKWREPSSAILDFSPYGYDERQYCSPGFNLPIGSSKGASMEPSPNIIRQPTI